MMKRRLLPMLLSLCLMVGLLGGFTVTASADDTVQYTMKAGDTVFEVCKKLNIDFYANQNWIIQANNIANFNNIKVGTVLTLPTKTGAALPASAGGGTTTTAAASVPGTVKYYLVDHPMAAGETVYGVCKALGIDFAANSEAIKRINGIKDYNKIGTGKIVRIPSAVAPTSGSYSTVVAYKVVAGDTVGAICRNYGIDYASNAETIKVLSGIENLGVIRPGQTLYLPVRGAASTGGVSVPTTGGGGTTAAPVNTTPQAGAFNVHTSSNGVFTLQVNGQIVNSAVAGQTVNVVAVPDQGYQMNQIVIFKTSTTERVDVKGTSFTMPDHDITIYVTFKAAN